MAVAFLEQLFMNWKYYKDNKKKIIKEKVFESIFFALITSEKYGLFFLCFKLGVGCHDPPISIWIFKKIWIDRRKK